MQAAAAAQAESTTRSPASSTTVNHRMQPVIMSMQSAAHRTLSPAIVHRLSPMPMPSGPSSRGQARQAPTDHPAKKAADFLEHTHGDIILKRRTPSQPTIHDEDYSITAISSGDPRQTSASRSRHRHEKRPSSKNDPHAQKQKHATAPASKSAPRRRWLKGRKEATPEAPNQHPQEKQDVPATKSKPKKTAVEGKKKSSENHRPHVLATANEEEQGKKESARAPLRIPDEREFRSDEEERPLMNKYISLKDDDASEIRRAEMIMAATPLQRSMRKAQQQKLSSTDGEILSKVDEDTRSVDNGGGGCLFLTDEVRLVVDSLDPPMVMLINRSWTTRSTATAMFSSRSPSLNRNCSFPVTNRFSIHRTATPVVQSTNRPPYSDVTRVNAPLTNCCRTDAHTERKRIPKEIAWVR